ncbi:hypothetical protein P691DRAFT_672023 [Macrolepiota fuliginosa MF-IS2]|uniref:Uncharacterized protein n=1 Tax=Macrolepiota fuliginosa MF-IS2 TaxID=1400762 RepID=A0A9P5XBF6_9AGAR|nr:hypothetical protein P691DRAFT_672023 [Macrolepiota fuliginosa MF-IS2]
MPPVLDIAHRGIVLSLVSLSAYGLYIGYASHSSRMARGKEHMARREEAERMAKQEELNEQALAQAAQNAISGRES